MNASLKSSGLLVSPALLALMLAACGSRGDSGSAGSGATNGGVGTTPGGSASSAAGIWSGALAPDGEARSPMPGWLVIGTDGTFNLDTDAALFMGKSTLRDQAVSVSAAAHPYGADPAGAITINATLADGTMTGTWSGNGLSGTLQFTRQPQISQQQASLATIASDYSGELWIRDARLPAHVSIGADGTLHATTEGTCALDGKVSIADAARNDYAWSGNASGCTVNGEARGSGFVIDGYSLYLSGTVQGDAIWLGGVGARAPAEAP